MKLPTVERFILFATNRTNNHTTLVIRLPGRVSFYHFCNPSFSRSASFTNVEKFLCCSHACFFAFFSISSSKPTLVTFRFLLIVYSLLIMMSGDLPKPILTKKRIYSCCQRKSILLFG